MLFGNIKGALFAHEKITYIGINVLMDFITKAKHVVTVVETVSEQPRLPPPPPSSLPTSEKWL